MQNVQTNQIDAMFSQVVDPGCKARTHRQRDKEQTTMNERGERGHVTNDQGKKES